MLDHLPELVQLQIGDYLDWSTLKSLGQVSSIYRRMFWVNPTLWQQKYLAQFSIYSFGSSNLTGSSNPTGSLNPIKDWHQAYFYQTHFETAMIHGNRHCPNPTDDYVYSWLNRRQIISVDGYDDYWVGVDHQNQVFRYTHRFLITPLHFDKPIISVAMIKTAHRIELFLDIMGRVWSNSNSGLGSNDQE